MAQRISSPCIFTTSTYSVCIVSSIVMCHLPECTSPTYISRDTPDYRTYIFLSMINFYFCLKLELSFDFVVCIRFTQWHVKFSASEKNPYKLTSLIRLFLCDDNFMKLKFLFYLPVFVCRRLSIANDDCFYRSLFRRLNSNMQIWHANPIHRTMRCRRRVYLPF